MASKITVSCVSWIDQASLPKVGFWVVAGAATSWPKRILMGLVGTSNPTPPLKIDKIETFTKERQYRALLACTVELNPNVKISDETLNPGYTPPFDKTKIDTILRSVAPIPDDVAFYPGEKSPLSSILASRLHPCSSLTINKGDTVIVSALIKFRAGKHTDDIGIEKANSPVHVPWVWSEFALISNKSGYRLLCNGSTFPSHAWYFNGKQVATQIQAQIAMSEHDSTLNTGQPASQPQTGASTDKSTGVISKHAQAIGSNAQFDIALPSLKM